jgi:hypothetical protein
MIVSRSCESFPSIVLFCTRPPDAPPRPQPNVAPLNAELSFLSRVNDLGIQFSRDLQRPFVLPTGKKCIAAPWL